jgi:ABC-type antimicrobial peptide transport system permease subunit
MAKTGLKEFVKAIVKIILIFLISIWLVGILSMINCVNTSVLNRSRELMMLRSVGMTRKQLRKSVILETIMFSATAAVIGTLLGLGIFLIFVYLLIREPNMLHIGKVATVLIASLTLNIIISLLSAIPAIRNLGKVEAIAQAAA